MATTEPRLMTADELLRLPDDNLRHELVRGELRTMSPAGNRQSRVGMRLADPLSHYIRAHALGEVWTMDPGFKLAENPDTVRAPDIAFVRRERLLEVGDIAGYWPGAPDLVVEIISPTDLYTEVEEKVAEWLAHGARLVWVVNPRRRTVAVHRPGQPVRMLAETDELDGEDVIPGWRLPVRELFAGLGQG